MIWRPNFGNEFGDKDFFLELNLTEETLSFTDISDATGVANRGLLQQGIFLGAAAYTQAITDTFDGSGQHFEPGVWANVPQTTNPSEPSTVVRMGSIPHGTTINMQGTALQAPAPRFAVSSITPFKFGSVDAAQMQSRSFSRRRSLDHKFIADTPNHAASLTQAQLTNPNLFLSQAIANQTMLGTTVLLISTDTKVLFPPPTSAVESPTSLFWRASPQAARTPARFQLPPLLDRAGARP